MKILIVDDSLIMRKAIESFLGPLNMEVVGRAEDGEKALELFRKHRPDIVTLDITMPKLDGLACLEQMMSMNPEAKVLVISALKDPATGLKALKTGAVGFLPKPFTEKQLESEMTEICGVTV